MRQQQGNAGMESDPPLFGPQAQRTMDGWPLQAPLLHGPQPFTSPPQEGSDRASSTSIPRELVQEEVRRQVVEAMRAQNEQIERLRQENETLRALRDPPPGLLQGNRASAQPPLPPGDRAWSTQEEQPQGTRASVQSLLPPGDRAWNVQEDVPHSGFSAISSTSR